MQGSLQGEYVRQSLDLRSWEAASDLVHGWEASGQIGVVKAEIPSIKDAVSKFFEDARPIAFDQQGVLTFEVVKPPNMQGHLFLQSVDRFLSADGGSAVDSAHVFRH